MFSQLIVKFEFARKLEEILGKVFYKYKKWFEFGKKFELN